MTLAQLVAEHYDELDAFYRDIWGDHVHHGLWLDGDESPQEAAELLLHLLIARGRIEPQARILDIGSGYGGTSRFLADQLAADVSAITLSSRQHEYAIQQPAPTHGTVSYEHGDFFDLQTGQPHDNVLAIECLSHMADPELFFARTLSMLKPGGRIAICAWMAAEHPTGWQRQYLLRPICKEGRLRGLARPSEIASWMIDAGFSFISFDDISRYVRHTWTFCFKQLVRRVVTTSSYRAYLLNAEHGNRTFALTLIRIWLAYHTGAMRYGIFVGEKPKDAYDSTHPSIIHKEKVKI